MLLLNGNIYKGSWIKGDRDGQGISYEKNNNTYYQGFWKEGKKQGKGIQKVSDK